MNVALYVGYL